MTVRKNTYDTIWYVRQQKIIAELLLNIFAINWLLGKHERDVNAIYDHVKRF